MASQTCHNYVQFLLVVWTFLSLWFTGGQAKASTCDVPCWSGAIVCVNCTNGLPDLTEDDTGHHALFDITKEFSCFESVDKLECIETPICSHRIKRFKCGVPHDYGKTNCTAIHCNVGESKDGKFPLSTLGMIVGAGALIVTVIFVLALLYIRARRRIVRITRRSANRLPSRQSINFWSESLVTGHSAMVAELKETDSVVSDYNSGRYKSSPSMMARARATAREQSLERELDQPILRPSMRIVAGIPYDEDDYINTSANSTASRQPSNIPLSQPQTPRSRQANPDYINLDDANKKPKTPTMSPDYLDM